jgi:nucleoside-diphosphate-sugar epimerase
MIFVTGATGFVGRALVQRLLADGQRLSAGLRSPTDALWPGEVEMRNLGNLGVDSLDTLDLSGVSTVVHCAGRAHVMQDPEPDPLSAFRRVNVAGTLSLAQRAAACGVRRFVYISSVKVNGERTAPGECFTETDIPAPLDAYGQSKYEAEEGLKAFATRNGMEWVIIRPPLVYGPGVKANFAALANAAANAWPLPLGGVHNKRSLVALENLVDFIACCVEQPMAANQTFLISDGQDLSTPELVRQLAQAAGTTARLPRIPLALLKTVAALLGKKSAVERISESLQVDISKARTLLRWVPPVTVAQGLARVFNGLHKS